jgi:hypothetical protein
MFFVVVLRANRLLVNRANRLLNHVSRCVNHVQTLVVTPAVMPHFVRSADSFRISGQNWLLIMLVRLNASRANRLRNHVNRVRILVIAVPSFRLVDFS